MYNSIFLVYFSAFILCIHFPVLLLPVGCWDLRETIENGDLVPSFRAVLRVHERMEFEAALAEERFGKPVTQVVIVIDFQQFSSRQLTCRTVVQGLSEFLSIMESNYPEILKSCVFINTSRLFSLFFAIIKPFLSNRTKNKMEFYGEQKKKWMPAILSMVSEEILPPYYGGTRAGSDEYCSDSGIWNDDQPLPRNFFASTSEIRRESLGDNTINYGESSQNGK